MQEEEKVNNVSLKNIPSEYKPLSMWAYFGYEILFSIPVFGWIILVANALSAKNKNLKNFTRSYFCLTIISIAITILGFIISRSYVFNL